MTLDENLVNNQLIALFNTNKVFSLQETIISWLPDQFQNYANLLSNFFTTTWFSRILPDIIKEHGMNKRLDVRCGFSKEFLQQGQLNDKHTAQFWFRENNQLELSGSVGCGVFVGKGIGENPMDLLQSVMGVISGGAPQKNNLGNEGDWKNFRSFFLSGSGKIQVEFKTS